jgi:hypothetical protein
MQNDVIDNNLLDVLQGTPDWPHHLCCDLALRCMRVAVFIGSSCVSLVSTGPAE